MKRLYLAILLASRLIVSADFNNVIFVDQNGSLLYTNFFTANKTLLNQAISQSQQFALTTSNLTATFGAGAISFQSGQSLSFAGGSVQLFPSMTNYVVLNYGTGRLHSLYRFLGGGGEHLLAVIQTGTTNVISSMQNWDFTGHPSRIGQARAKLLRGPTRFDVILLGDSLTEASGTGTMWKDLLFSQTYQSLGYNVTNVTTTQVRNFGLGGMNADYGLALLSRSAQSFGYPWQSYGGHGDPLDLAGVNGGTTASRTYTPQAGMSHVWTPFPDLAIVSFGVNYATTGYGKYSWTDLESIGRALQERGVATLYTTENDFTNSPLSCNIIAQTVTTLMNGIGGAVADTAAYVDEQNRLGNNTYADTVHQTQTGWNAWAEAVLGVLNPYSQRTITVTPHTGRLIDPTTSTEAPYSGLSATYVSGTSISTSAGAILTNTAASTATYLPGAFGQTAVYNLKGTANVLTNYADYYHSCWTSAQLIFERGLGTNTFGGYSAWLDASGAEHVMQTFGYTDSTGTQRPGSLDLASITQVLPAITALSSSGLMLGSPPGLWNHGAVRVAITNGNARVLGVMFRGPKHRKVTLRGGSNLSISPAWFDDPLDPYGWYPHSLATDTVGESVGFRFAGKALQMTVRASTAGGQVTCYGDGDVIATQDLYTLGQPNYILQFTPGLTTGIDISRGSVESTFVLTYTGNNGSRVAQRFGYHSVMIVDAVVIE